MPVLKQLFQRFFRKIEPSDLSYNVNVAIALTLVILHFRYAIFSFAGTQAAIFYSIIYCVAQTGFVYLMLRLSDKSPRFVQTLTALLGVTLVFAIGFVAMAVTVIFAILIPFIVIWYLYISYLIIKSAFESTALKAVGITIVYLTVGELVLALLVPQYQVDVQAETERLLSLISEVSSEVKTEPSQ